MNLFSSEFASARRVHPVLISGRVSAVRGLSVLAKDFPVPIGSLVEITTHEKPILGEVVGFDGEHTIAMLLAETTGIAVGATICAKQVHQSAMVGSRLLGRVIDGLGNPLDSKGPINEMVARPLNPDPISPMQRRRVNQSLRTGVRAIDLMTPIGRGQRLGIFAGPGVGKSTLLGQIAQGTEADINVIALIGERGREVKDFIEESLGEEGLKRSVVVVATGDESPLLRLRAAKLACATAEYFRDQGKDVLLMMDSVTRFAHAQRQVGLSVGEPPATKGYTPSVFSSLAVLLERAGAIESVEHTGGSITGLYTILVEGDDLSEPISDAARGILDGHVILSRKLAQKGHFPAIDVLDSVSRVAGEVSDAGHTAARHQIMRLLAAYRDVEDLVQIGAYASGANPDTDTAIDMVDVINELLMQRSNERAPFEPAQEMLLKLAFQAGEMIAHRKAMGATTQGQPTTPSG